MRRASSESSAGVRTGSVLWLHRWVSVGFDSWASRRGFAWGSRRKFRPSAWPPRLQRLRNIKFSSAWRPVSAPCQDFANLKFPNGAPASALLIFRKVFPQGRTPISPPRHPPTADRQSSRRSDNRRAPERKIFNRSSILAAPFFIKVLKIFLPGVKSGNGLKEIILWCKWEIFI